MYECLGVYVYMSLSADIFLCTYVSISIICKHILISSILCMCVCVCVCVCLCVCVCVCADARARIRMDLYI